MDQLKRIGLFILVVVCLPLLVVVVGGFLTWWFACGVALRIWFWRAHAAHGRSVLLVYSESRNWQPYIESRILPRISERAVVLNWSQRRHWKSVCPWEARFFKHFAGTREFNPLAIVFGRCGRIRSVRFHQAFLDFKHGKESRLRVAAAELCVLLDTA